MEMQQMNNYSKQNFQKLNMIFIDFCKLITTLWSNPWDDLSRVSFLQSW